MKKKYDIKKIGFAAVHEAMPKGRGLRLVQSINKCEKDGNVYYCTFAQGYQGSGTYNDWACYVALNNKKQGVVLCGCTFDGWCLGYVRPESNPDMSNINYLVITSEDERARYFDNGFDWGEEECDEMFSSIKIKDDKNLRMEMLNMVMGEVDDWVNTDQCESEIPFIRPEKLKFLKNRYKDDSGIEGQELVEMSDEAWEILPLIQGITPFLTTFKRRA